MRRQILIGSLLLTLGLLSAVAFSKEGEQALKPADSAAGALIDQLADQDFSVRKKAEQKLLELGDKAVPALEKAAKDHKDPNVRYEAGRLLAKIRGDSRAGAAPAPSGSVDRELKRMQDSMDELLKQLEGQGLLDDQALARIRDMMNRPIPTGPGGSATGGASGLFEGTVIDGGTVVRFHRSADGHVKVDINRNGTEQSYQADSLDALKKANPDVYRTVTKYFGNVHARSFGVPLRNLPGKNLWPWPHPFSFGQGRRPGTAGERPLREQDTTPPDGFRLGVWVGQIGEPLRVQLGLAKDEGILVESVVPGSLADRLGVERFDVITKVNGEKVTGVDSVRSALAGVSSGSKVELTVVRKAKTISLLGNR